MGLLPKLLARLDGKAPAKSQLVLDGKTIDVVLRKNPRAKRIILRLAKSNDGIVLTVPPGTSHRAAMEFAASQGVWIAQQMAKQPGTVSFEAGARVPLRNVMHIVVHSDKQRTPVWTGTGDDGRPVIYVSGDQLHHARRVADWLRKQARADLSRAAHCY
ncbi:MAG TPA: M48 family peptidase, partial [Rhizobiales bacterium]|nr:M48 family peptidase [Hyphomicrobiales bacterium]